MPNTIQPLNPLQNGQMVNLQDRLLQPKPAEKPPERLEPALNDRPERAEARNVPSTRRAEENPAEESQSREDPHAENLNPQETQDNQGNTQRGNTLDIMA